MSENKQWYIKGLRDGVPIALGYFAVAFTLGIVAKSAGLTAFQAGLAALLTNASAGGYAGFTLISAGAGYFELALTETYCKRKISSDVLLPKPETSSGDFRAAQNACGF